MQMVRNTIVLAFISALALTGCSSNKKTPDLLSFKNSSTGPDEFAVLPGKSLQNPDDFTTLPAPTPGGSNLTDPTPDVDAVNALGGRGSLLERNGKLGADSALVNHASRFGLASGIRKTLASEDLEYRRRHNGRLLERWFSVNIYARAYRSQSLDRYLELRRLRLAGVRTPAAPPRVSTAQ